MDSLQAVEFRRIICTQVRLTGGKREREKGGARAREPRVSLASPFSVVLSERSLKRLEKTRIDGRSSSWPQPYALLCALILPGSALLLSLAHRTLRGALLLLPNRVTGFKPIGGSVLRTHVPLLILRQIRRLHNKSWFVTSAPQQTYPF